MAAEAGVLLSTFIRFRKFMGLGDNSKHPRSIASRAAGRRAKTDRKNAELYSAIREKHALGWHDSEIAAELGLDRRAVCDIRIRIGLPSNALNDRRRDKVRQKTLEQLKSKGLASLAEERVTAYRARARAAGWPEWMPPRAVQILNLLWDRGPMTRLELIRVMRPDLEPSQLSRKRVNKALHCNLEDCGGSYLSALLRTGFVYAVRRGLKQPGKGKSVDVYCLSNSIKRGKVYGQIAEDGSVTLKSRRVPAAVDGGDAKSGARGDQAGGH